MSLAITRRTATILAAALPTVITGRARAALPPITDAAGRTVVLPAPAERIVLGFNFEEFTAVAGPDGWKRVVGFDKRQWAINRPATWDRYKAVIPGLADLPDVGDTETGTFSAERVLSLRPDLLVMLAAGYTLRAAEMAQVAAAGVPILLVDYNAQTVEKHVAGTLALGRATGNEERARVLAELYRGKVADIRRRAEGLPTPKVYVENGSAGPATFGNTYNDAMWGRMLQTAGSTNIAAGRIPTGWAPLAPETVLAAAPDQVFLLGASWASSPNAVKAGFGVSEAEARRSIAAYADRTGWSALPAVRDRELHVLETSLARSLWDWTATEYIAKQLHPERFGDVDPVADLRRYHEQYLPVAFDGCWMTRLAP